MSSMPEEGFLRLVQILGDARTCPPILPIIPIGKTAWLKGVDEGIFPPPIKLTERTRVWRVSDIRQLIKNGKWSAEEVATR